MKDERVYIWDMVQACKKIKRYLAGKTMSDLLSDDMMFDAVVREFQILGEAASKTNADFKSRFKNIPWRKIIDMRNLLIHEYATIEVSRIWETAQHDLPSLLASLLPIFEKIEKEISSEQ